MTDMIRKVEAERDALAAHDNVGQVSMLTRLSGIAAISAHVLVNEVFHRAFANRGEVAAYCGLTSSPYNSGAMTRGSAGPGTEGRDLRQSSWRGYGCATSPRADSAAGSTSASARRAAGLSAS